MEHGAGTRASFKWSFSYYWKALLDLCMLQCEKGAAAAVNCVGSSCRSDHTCVQSGRWNALVLTGIYGYMVSIFAGVPARVFSRNSTLTPLCCIVAALIVGLTAAGDLCAHAWTWKDIETGGTPITQVSSHRNTDQLWDLTMCFVLDCCVHAD